MGLHSHSSIYPVFENPLQVRVASQPQGEISQTSALQWFSLLNLAFTRLLRISTKPQGGRQQCGNFSKASFLRNSLCRITMKLTFENVYLTAREEAFDIAFITLSAGVCWLICRECFYEFIISILYIYQTCCCFYVPSCLYYFICRCVLIDMQIVLINSWSIYYTYTKRDVAFMWHIAFIRMCCTAFITSSAGVCWLVWR